MNGMHDSFTPLGGMVPLINIMLGEVVFGGVGSGLYGVVVFVILAVFIAGLMVGRTPEYLGKKIESYDVQMAMLSILIMTFAILGFSAFSVVEPFGTSSISNPGPHGLSQILYAYTSIGRQQRLRLCRTERQHALVQHQRSRGHVAGPLLHAHSDHSPSPGTWRRRKIAPESAGTFPVTGRTFRALACFHDSDRERAHVFPGT